MCGISVLYGSSISEPVVSARRMLFDMRHRGPDGVGLAAWSRATAWRTCYSKSPDLLPRFWDGPADCVLGHNWLAIQDTRPGARQPMFLGDLGLTFNGEIYNFLELREHLAAQGCDFETDSDTEVLLHLWRAMGPGCLNLLRGMFAFAVFDSEHGVLWAARDPFGIKPLYYAKTSDGVVLASEIRGIHASGLVRRQLRDTAVIASCAAGVNKFGNTETLYEGVMEVPPGSWIRVVPGNIHSETYYHLPELSCDADGDEAVRALRAAVESSVQMHLRSTRRMATCLSGGLDSSNLAWCIRDALGPEARSFTAFTICNAAPEDSEIAAAKELTRVAGLDHEVVDRADRLDLADAVQMTVAYEIPNHVIGPINQFLLLRRIRRSGGVVVLDGQGGDELLSGYAWYGAVLVEAIRRMGGDAGTFDEMRRGRLPFSLEINRAFEQIFADPGCWIGAFIGGGPDFLGVPAGQIRELPETKYYLSGGADWASLRVREYYQGDLPLLLRQEDRLGMWFGIECRVPFVDREMVEVASHLRPELLLRDGYLKYPFRCMIPEIPEAIRWNIRKRGFWETDVSLARWLAEEGRVLIMGSSQLRRLFPGLEAGWDRLNFDQRWRLFQHAILARCCTGEEGLELCNDFVRHAGTGNR